MTRYHRATKTCRYGNDGSVAASPAAGRPARKGADGADNPSDFQARKRRPPGVLSSLIQGVPGRRLTAMNAHATAQPADALSAATYRASGPLLGVKHLVARQALGSGGCPPAFGMGATAGTPGREGG
jgi:hypothetical protein